MVGGPNYETVAELKLLSLLGVDSVGKIKKKLYLYRNIQNTCSETIP